MPDITPSRLTAPYADVSIVADWQRTALKLPPGLTFEQWESLGSTVAAMVDGAPWWMGDWLSYGERAYGEKYAHVVDGTPWKIQTLQNYAWVSRRFEISRRREILSFSHHAEVAALDPADQDALLDRAEAESWSRADLRTAVRELKRNRLPAPQAAEGKAELTAAELAEFGPEPEVDLGHELDLALADIERLEAQVKALSASDLGTELRTWMAKYAQLEGRVRQLSTESHTATKQARWQGDVLRKVRAALGVEKSGEIMPALLRLVNTA